MIPARPSRSNRLSRASQLGWLLVLLGSACLLAILQLGTGSRAIAFSAMVDAALSFDAGNFDHQILFNLRLPRLEAAALCGACLGMSGLLLQTLLRNPLAEPHILGLNAGASLALVACTALPAALAPREMANPLIASLGGGGLFALVVALASAGRTGMTMMKVTFCGIALSAMASAFVSAILLLDQETLEQMRLWLAGDLASASRDAVAAALPVALLGALAALGIAPRLDAMMLGDQSAVALGVPVKTTRMIGLGAAAILCGTAVSIAGPIGFVGLVVPGIAWRLSGKNHAFALFLSALCGCILLLAADITGRTIAAPAEIATGIMTAFVGAPVFLIIVSRKMR